MSNICIEDLTIQFRVYNDRAPSLKQSFAEIFKKKNFTKSSNFKAIDSVSLEINAGDRVGIVGHNGAGKSTLLKALCRIYPPSQGKIAVEGRIAPLLEIGAGFHPEFTGRENIYLNGAILGYNKKELKDCESEVISFAGLERFIDMPVKYYSTGMYMRLAFSLATAIHPEILILDEVFAGGDAQFLAKAKDRMHEFINKASIMIMVSHDHNLIQNLCNRVIWLDRGKVVADGSSEEIVCRYLASTG